MGTTERTETEVELANSQANGSRSVGQGAFNWVA